MINPMIGQTISFLPIGLNDIEGNSEKNIDYIKIENGIYDDLYVTHIDRQDKDRTPNEFDVPDEWTKDTYLHAKFNGDLFSGNADFNIDNVSNIILKRRVKGTYRWLPMFEIEVDSVEDFSFIIIDPYAASETVYEYAVVPIINGLEGTYSISECKVEFDNLVIMDNEDTYGTLFDIEVSQQKNNISSVITPIQSKYPIYVTNALSNYFTGNISATFVRVEKKNDHFYFDEVAQYRDEVLEFLNNRKIKYIKDPYGRCWIASIGNAISDESNGHHYSHKISFDFTEVGDFKSNEDMNKFGFLDIGEEWWSDGTV